ncbi:MAG: chromate transporter [Syntrophobacteraceae bacterium]|nr:chromate transporter [Syntrophobacteraceae bacterium]
MNIFCELALSFIKIGFFGFGGGFAMIPLMQSVAVHQTGWLSPSQFGAAIALGQVTPGPVAISATFIGYKVAGLAGAVVATAAIFAPSLLCMYLLEKFYLKVRGKEITQAIMHGVLPVVAAIILIAAISLCRQSTHSVWQAGVIAAVAALAISRRVSYGLLVAGSMTVGIVMAFICR